MAPTTVNIRLSEAEAEIAKLTHRMNAIAKDGAIIEDEVRALNAAVFGDRHNPQDRPGMVHEMREMRKSVASIEASISKLIWLVVSGLVAGGLSLLIKH